MENIEAGAIGLALGLVTGIVFVAEKLGTKVCQNCKTNPNYNICTDMKIDTTRC